MGRVRTNLIKKAAKHVIEKYFARLTLDFDTNKRIVDEVAKVPSKRIRNKISGFITHLIKRIARGPVRGISLKLQEEERERSLDFIPEHSALDVEKVDIDDDTQNMLRSLDFPNIPGVVVSNNADLFRRRRGGGEGGRGGKRGGRGGGAGRGGKGKRDQKPKDGAAADTGALGAPATDAAAPAPVATA